MTAQLMEIIQAQQDSNQEVMDSGEASALEISQLLSFTIENQVFAADIKRVFEIRAWEPVTYLPNAPDYLVGVLNLRGIIVPVMDLRIRFQFKFKDYDSTTVIIVFRTENGDRERLMGCVVDSVSDVLELEAEQLKEMPDFEAGIEPKFTEGLVEHEGQVVTLLNLEQLLSLDLILHPYTRTMAKV